MLILYKHVEKTLNYDANKHLLNFLNGGIYLWRKRKK